MGRGRNDDAPDIIRRRLQIYREQTEPMLSYYQTAIFSSPSVALGRRRKFPSASEWQSAKKMRSPKIIEISLVFETIKYLITVHKTGSSSAGVCKGVGNIESKIAT